MTPTGRGVTPAAPKPPRVDMPNQLNGMVPLRLIGEVFGEHVRTPVVSGTIFSNHFPFGICLMQKGKVDPMGAADVATSGALSGFDYPDCSFIVFFDQES